MVVEQSIRRYRTAMTFCAVVIRLASITGSATGTIYFGCHGDICNVEQVEQFCSEKFKHCRSCSEIVEDCFTQQMPFNCSSTCISSVRLNLSMGSNVYAYYCPSRLTPEESLVQDLPLYVSCSVALKGEHEVERRLAAQRDTTCKRLPFIRNGAWSNDSVVFDVGETISAICQDGLALVGSGLWNCTTAGWVSLRDENVMPSCHDNKWFTAFIIVLAVLVLVLGSGLGLYVVMKCRKKRRNTQDKTEDVDSADNEQTINLLGKDEGVEQNDVENCKTNVTGKTKPDFVRTISLEDQRKVRQKITLSDVKEEVQTETEQPTGKTDPNLKTGTGHVNFHLHVSNNVNNNIGNVNPSSNAVPENIMRKDACTQSANKSEEGKDMKGTKYEDLKLPEEESATSEQRQPLDAYARPEIDESGSSSTYPVTLNPGTSLDASADACRGTPIGNASPRAARNHGNGLENEINDHYTRGKDETEVAIGIGNIPQGDVIETSISPEIIYNVRKKGIKENGAIEQDAGKIAIGIVNATQEDINGKSRTRNDPSDVPENVITEQEVTEQDVGKMALGSNNIPLGDIDGTSRAENARIRAPQFAHANQGDIIGRNVGKMSVRRDNTGLPDINGTFRIVNGHTPTIPLETHQSSHL